MADGDTEFDRATAVEHQRTSGPELTFAGNVHDGWRAGRGPHGGYLAAIITRALMMSVSDAARSPRSLTIHYVRAPEPGPVLITTVLEREGRSLSSLTARMHQDGRLMAIALAAFSVPWAGPEITELQMPDVEPPAPGRAPGTLVKEDGPPFAQKITLQRRTGGMPFEDSSQPMETGCWLALAEPRTVDPISLALYADALIPTPFMKLSAPAPAPTIDLTIHFRAATPRISAPADEMCFAQSRSQVVHEGLFEEDMLIWGADGVLLAQSRQLAIVMPGGFG